MLNLVIKKWIEPYKLLETIKDYSTVEEFSFDGSNKSILKSHFLKQLKTEKGFGLYMKNVNKFYLFDVACNVKEILTKNFELSDEDWSIFEDEDTPFSLVDSGKAEAAFFMY